MYTRSTDNGPLRSISHWGEISRDTRQNRNIRNHTPEAQLTNYNSKHYSGDINNLRPLTPLRPLNNKCSNNARSCRQFVLWYVKEWKLLILKFYIQSHLWIMLNKRMDEHLPL